MSGETINMNLVVSIGVSIVMAIVFIWWQIKEYKTNEAAIQKLSRFFAKKKRYMSSESVTITDDQKTVKNIAIENVAEDDAELKNLIEDINGYIFKSKGTVAFSIIQNKTERRITMLYEIATSKLSFPTHIGLMGTFAGVFLGLIMFLFGTWLGGGITDTNIQSLISGVLVSMLTSCVGIFLLIMSHRAASDATNLIDKDKNEFYEWVQNELMPTVDVSMVEAIGKLHETINQFEPTFSKVITEFKSAFKDVTGAFGDDFRLSVDIIREAVDKMGKNIDKINDNIDLQNDLLDTVKSRELVQGMDAFVTASQRFREITGSLDQFEKARRIMLVAAQESINIQQSYNESLLIPKQVATEINMILNRITTFEKNIEGLGENIAHTQMVGSELINQIKENINAIKSKQKVAEKMADTANEKLEHYFEEHKKELGRIAQKYNEALDSYLSDYETMLRERKSELESRKREFTQAIDEKFNVADIRNEFTSLRKLNDIASRLEQLVNNGVKSGLVKTELEAIKSELIALNEKEAKGGGGGVTLFGGSSTSDESRRKISTLQSEVEELKGLLTEAKESSRQTQRELQITKDKLQRVVTSRPVSVIEKVTSPAAKEKPVSIGMTKDKIDELIRKDQETQAYVDKVINGNSSTKNSSTSKYYPNNNETVTIKDTHENDSFNSSHSSSKEAEEPSKKSFFKRTLGKLWK